MSSLLRALPPKLTPRETCSPSTTIPIALLTVLKVDSSLSIESFIRNTASAAVKVPSIIVPAVPPVAAVIIILAPMPK